MPSFLHLPTCRLIETDNHSQSLRYRRSSNFFELTEDATTSSQSHTVASDSPPSTPDDLDTAGDEIRIQAATNAGADEAVPKGSVPDILEWAGTDPARRTAALIAEKNGKQRVTLIRALESDI